MANIINKVKVEVSPIDGHNLTVQAFELRAAINAIPTITLHVLPVELSAAPQNKPKLSSSHPDFEDLTRLYSQLLSLTSKLQTKASVSIEVTSSLEEQAAEHLWLNNWILSDVGLSSVSSYTAPVLTIILSHPIIKLDNTGTIYEQLKTDTVLFSRLKAIDGNDPVTIMDKVYDLYARGEGIAFFGVAATDAQDAEQVKKLKDYRTCLEQSENKPSTYLSCDAPLFLSNVDALATKLIKFAIAKLAKPDGFDTSTWGRIVGKLAPSMLMQVTPEFTEPVLKLEPYEPWKKPELFLAKSTITTIDITPADPTPIIGVAIYKENYNDKPKDSGASMYHPRETTQTSNIAVYIPTTVQIDVGSKGGIQPVGNNPIITLAKGASLGGTTTDEEDTEAEESSLDRAMTAGENTKDLSAQQQEITKAVESKLYHKYAKAMFLANYRRNCSSLITTILKFKDVQDNPIYPGQVMTISLDEKASAFPSIVTGLVTSMVVSGDAMTGGSIQYELSHVRAPESSILVEEDTKNPCYE